MLTTNDRDNDNMDNGNTRDDDYNGNYDKDNEHIDNDDEDDGIYEDRDNAENGKRGQL